MTLAFSTELNKKPTYFVEKILSGLMDNYLMPKIVANDFLSKYFDKYTGRCITLSNAKPKIHTMRVDEHDRWKAGTLIHFVINNRTPSRYQFAPVIKCVSEQKVIIKYWYDNDTQLFTIPMILINGRVLTNKEIDELAINDGFESVIDFLAYFNTDWSGKLIHWTNKKY